MKRFGPMERLVVGPGQVTDFVAPAEGVEVSFNPRPGVRYSEVFLGPAVWRVSLSWADPPYASSTESTLLRVPTEAL
jgi:hypothetical protein